MPMLAGPVAPARDSAAALRRTVAHSPLTRCQAGELSRDAHRRLARLGQVSVRMLRHYDRIGLLTPARGRTIGG
ncbi:MAG TPA: MerR family DNA-binding transcriptional regulator [Ornithinimicrobium sp.]|uniref:MerR family DNA-binding transcriptional regulator n=1 Tax=Ornithinimicrobium sp. TaxID=1977084 RepID=UPI002B4829B5|nr:MerR family DNA-binding transcriptional regulator [Ornithinimicrobium sp.]HKJ12194.1 MerR family DNA-binding transcriptional regulator [Ornithinimicrobium sp.]